ncbi:DUF1660 family phage protein [Microscilla marina]|uniref:Uncharacterized protein n=1 Tax=Microscilla marina ATCC 23134 TaxID=313606 RepID=A1ZYQ8_MICM2|nr:DUF1660 family phage protein [Microscilla marina]EAY24482.1 hypothetical protein M23134_06469 [Microscilla marina ATCC 23134]
MKKTMHNPAPIKIPLACKIWGHKWQGDSLKRRCTRCGKTQVSRYSVEGWVDV